MGTIADDLGTVYFQLSSVGVGALAVGVADIRQRIANVLNTIPGTDPFRPFFGCLAYTWSDKPVNTAIPNIKKEIFESLSLWMPEIQVLSITHSIAGDARLLFNVTYVLADDELIDAITYALNGEVTGEDTANSIIITAVVPAKVTNGVYKVFFTVNGEPVLPSIPPQGWTSATDMYSWINTNWSRFGRWYLTGTTLVLYLNTSAASTATLNVTETSILSVKALAPTLAPGEFYSVGFTVNGGAPSPAFPGNINTTEDLLAWVTNNWGNYGRWYILNNGTVISEGDYNGDYYTDFDSGGITDSIYLVFQSDTATAATLIFN